MRAKLHRSTPDDQAPAPPTTSGCVRRRFAVNSAILSAHSGKEARAMRRLALVSVLLSVGMLAQAQEPPGLLPASITGRKPDAAAGVTPASGTLTQPAAPVARFQDERAFPPETQAVLQATKSGADWLWRMNQ